MTFARFRWHLFHEFTKYFLTSLLSFFFICRLPTDFKYIHFFSTPHKIYIIHNKLISVPLCLCLQRFRSAVDDLEMNMDHWKSLKDVIEGEGDASSLLFSALELRLLVMLGIVGKLSPAATAIFNFHSHHCNSNTNENDCQCQIVGWNAGATVRTFELFGRFCVLVGNSRMQTNHKHLKVKNNN